MASIGKRAKSLDRYLQGVEKIEWSNHRHVEVLCNVGDFHFLHAVGSTNLSGDDDCAVAVCGGNQPRISRRKEIGYREWFIAGLTILLNPVRYFPIAVNF